MKSAPKVSKAGYGFEFMLVMLEFPIVALVLDILLAALVSYFL
jgi:hypothetical protein